MKEELTKKMHSELSVSKDIEIKHKAGCVWDILKVKHPSEKEIKDRCKSYGISYEDAMKWKDFWIRLQ